MNYVKLKNSTLFDRDISVKYETIFNINFSDKIDNL